MKHSEFSALTRGLRSIHKKNPGSALGAGTDASAFHGRPGARVALLQSPILPAVLSPYMGKKEFFEGLPLTTHIPVFRSEQPYGSRVNLTRRNPLPVEPS
jgi:hypothetical protein